MEQSRVHPVALWAVVLGLFALLLWFMGFPWGWF